MVVCTTQTSTFLKMLCYKGLQGKIGRWQVVVPPRAPRHYIVPIVSRHDLKTGKGKLEVLVLPVGYSYNNQVGQCTLDRRKSCFRCCKSLGEQGEQGLQARAGIFCHGCLRCIWSDLNLGCIWLHFFECWRRGGEDRMSRYNLVLPLLWEVVQMLR